MGAIQELAAELGAEERTLRRAASQGTLRGRRPGPRRFELGQGEREYLHAHWQLIAALRMALRTQPRVRLAVLYGSVARGDEDETSDLDLLVDLDQDPKPLSRVRLSLMFEDVTGRRVDVAALSHVQKSAPFLLSQVLKDGRVLVDRDGTWPKLHAGRRAIHERGRRAYRRQLASAQSAVEELTQ